jgi:hypothetical protein
MYVILWRYNASSPWYLHNKPLGSEQDVRAEINSMVRYDVAGRREYRWQTIGDVSTWHDPFAEQAARDDEARDMDANVRINKRRKGPFK